MRLRLGGKVFGFIGGQWEPSGTPGARRLDRAVEDWRRSVSLSYVAHPDLAMYNFVVAATEAEVVEAPPPASDTAPGAIY